MIRRVLVAAVAIPTAILVVHTGGWALSGLLSVFAALGAAEVFKLAERGGVRPLKELGYIGAAFIPVAVFAANADGLGLGYDYILFAAPVFLIAVMADNEPRPAIDLVPLEPYVARCIDQKLGFAV